MSEAGYDNIIKWAKSILPEENRLKENFYTARSMMKPLGLGYQKFIPKFLHIVLWWRCKFNQLQNL
jgi:hypothetical protein